MRLRQAAAAARAGFGCVKVKVGVGDDAGRIAAVRAAVGPAIAIRVDANGAWSSVDEALAHLRALAPAGLEYAEEPVGGVDALRALRAVSPVPVAMDETAARAGRGRLRRDRRGLPQDRPLRRDHGLLRDARAARAAGSAVYVASTFDGPLGVAAAVHAAAALAASGPVAYCGLATLGAVRGARRRCSRRVAARSPCRRVPACWELRARERRHLGGGSRSLAALRHGRTSLSTGHSPD